MGLLDNLNFSQPFSLSSLLPSEAQLQAYKDKSDAEAIAQYSQDLNPIRRGAFNLLTALGVNPTLAKAAPTTADVLPVTGDISALADAKTAFGKGDYVTGGLLSMAALPFVPASKVKGLLKPNRTEEIAKLRAEANALRFGEDVDTSYRVQHQAKGYDDGDPIRLDNLTKSIDGGEAGYPDDFYTPKGRMLYAPPARFPDDEYGIANTQSYDAILKAKGNPEAEVTIYRAVPNEENITKINEGDFVTLSPKYAELHGASGYGSRGEDAGKILSQKVKVKDLLWDGNDVNEFGYFPKN
jgi:hypothetical protein